MHPRVERPRRSPTQHSSRSIEILRLPHDMPGVGAAGEFLIFELGASGVRRVLVTEEAR